MKLIMSWSIVCPSFVALENRVTRTHFDKMAMALNSRLPEVVFIPTPSTRIMSRLKIWQEESSSGDSSSSSPSPIPSPSPMFE